MVNLALSVLVVGLVSALLGLTGVVTAGAAQLVFFSFLLLFLISLIRTLVPALVRRAAKRRGKGE
jgi:uncharacterized membrane protein YtjA (UPF0391 family)